MSPPRRCWWQLEKVWREQGAQLAGLAGKNLEMAHFPPFSWPGPAQAALASQSSCKDCDGG